MREVRAKKCSIHVAYTLETQTFLHQKRAFVLAFQKKFERGVNIVETILAQMESRVKCFGGKKPHRSSKPDKGNSPILTSWQLQYACFVLNRRCFALSMPPSESPDVASFCASSLNDSDSQTLPRQQTREVGAPDISSPVLQATIDSLPAHLAILDDNGTIISLNSAWRRYALDNDFSGHDYGLGANYLDVCARATGANAVEAPLVLRGLKDVLSGERDEFYLEYPCHSPTEQRWYALRATRFGNSASNGGEPDGGAPDGEPVRVVVTHEDISLRKLTEIRLREETEVTATLYRIGLIVAGELDASKLVEAITQTAVDLTGAHIGAFLPAVGGAVQGGVAASYSAGAGASDPAFALTTLDPNTMFGRDFVAHETPSLRSLPQSLTAPDDAATNAATSPALSNDLRADDLQTDVRFACDSTLATGDMAAKSAATNGETRANLRTPFGAGHALASYLAAPIIARSGEWLGALFLGHPLPDQFGKNAELLLHGLAGQAALSLENARLFEQAQREKAALSALEERYRLVTEQMPQIVWMADARGAHLYFNRRWFDFTGLSARESYGSGWSKSLHPDDADRAQMRWQHSLDTGAPYEIEYRFRRHDGEYHWFLARALPLRDEAGRVSKWFGTCTDIDDAKAADAQRARALESEERARLEAENANRLKDEFLAVVSHELRTPLTPILGWLELLKTDDPDANFRKQAYEVIERNTRAQAQIVNDLLDVSRIISGKLKLELRAIDLRDVVRAAIETVEPTARVKGVHLDADLPARAAINVGDADRLQQVAWNLISNAVKFTARGGQVTVRLSRQNSQYLIEIVDSGAGIAPEFLPHVFERFRQADASSTRATGGLGLGLSIVRHLVEQHGGTVGVDSRGLGLGSTFRVCLPIAPIVPAEPEKDGKMATEGEVAPDERQSLNGLKILAVDDEADAREMLQLVLSRYGARVETAPNVREALEKLERFCPDMVLSDIGMPEADGYSLIEQIRALPASKGGQTPAIALTAYARNEDHQRALDAGFQNHLAKPIEPAKLVAALRELAGHSSFASD